MKLPPEGVVVTVIPSGAGTNQRADVHCRSNDAQVAMLAIWRRCTEYRWELGCASFYRQDDGVIDVRNAHQGTVPSLSGELQNLSQQDSLCRGIRTIAAR